MLSIPAVTLLAAAVAGFAPAELWEAWPNGRFVPTPAACLSNAELGERLKALAAKHPGRIKLEEVGRSFEGRTIQLLTLGSGPRKVLLWSQMHGDEPSATPALLDVADFLLSHRESPAARAILDGTTLLIVPRLNPDGAERYQRRNAQYIDINRDALNLATPEGRLLKSLRESHQPELGFNLHDQNRRTTVGETGKRSTIALLAVAGDPEGTLTPGRLRAKRVCAAIVTALSAFIPGAVSRYDEDWSPRAFGDNLTAWGTPVVLIESGGLQPGITLGDLTRLNFVALVTALADLVRDDLAGYDPATYENLARNQTGTWSDVIVAGGEIYLPGGGAAYRADLAFNIFASDLTTAGCPAAPLSGRSAIAEVGDARQLSAGRKLDAAGLVMTPGFVASVRGNTVRDWLTRDVLLALGRLGVVKILWHADDPEATNVAVALAGERQPVLEIVPAGAPEVFLRLAGPPQTPRGRSLGDFLDALLGLGRHAEAVIRPVPTLLDLLAGLPKTSPARLAPEAPASFVLLRTGASMSEGQTAVVSVWIDGREVN